MLTCDEQIVIKASHAFIIEANRDHIKGEKAPPPPIVQESHISEQIHISVAQCKATDNSRIPRKKFHESTELRD